MTDKGVKVIWFLGYFAALKATGVIIRKGHHLKMLRRSLFGFDLVVRML